jgi:hypothetical protein
MYKTILDLDKYGFIQTYMISDKKQRYTNQAVFRYIDHKNGSTGLLVDDSPKYEIWYAYPSAKVHVEHVIANKNIDTKILEIRWRRWQAAKVIQRAWRRCISDPEYKMCHNRLLQEWASFKAFLRRV